MSQNPERFTQGPEGENACAGMEPPPGEKMGTGVSKSGTFHPGTGEGNHLFSSLRNFAPPNGWDSRARAWRHDVVANEGDSTSDC